ncbi:dTDP-4-dehydrorhamnose reductase [Rossellomorea sp. AcN35-11]|nr:dTDP-4-dehydrorhamnose reductase [Rossellomorea aquimaris]WJV29541.1 dTDP-4-dehydrorhamnose reductase [Rossellomorea sp. AcN35-11]
MNKVLVTGAGGQLGSDLIKYLERSGYTVFGQNKVQMDITDQVIVQETIWRIQPDIIIHCAAYTKVDEAETNVDKAFLINALGTRHLVTAAEQWGAVFIYISTDYVFDGKSRIPYHEYSPVSPVNTYGQSKLAGEMIVKEIHSKYFIVRTSWLFGSKGPNFVRTMLKLADEKAFLSVVDDQRGSPTYTGDLSKAILQLIETKKFGTYHVTNSDSCTWYEFAKEIFKEAGLEVDLRPCETEQFPRPAARPSYSVMDHMALRINGFPPMPSWKDGLKRYMGCIDR